MTKLTSSANLAQHNPQETSRLILKESKQVQVHTLKEAVFLGTDWVGLKAKCRTADV